MIHQDESSGSAFYIRSGSYEFYDKSPLFQAMHDSGTKKPKVEAGHFGEQLVNWGEIFGDEKTD